MLVWIIATVLAFFVKGLCGFANTLVFTSVMSFGTDNINISPVELVLGYPANAMIAIKERKSIDWKKALPIAALVIVGSIPGIFFLKNANTNVLKIIFGILVIAVGIEMLFRELKPTKIHENKVVLTLIGIVAGVFCGLYGVGVLLAAYLNRVTKDMSSFKGNMCIVFFLENTFRIITYICFGIITIEVAKKALILMPFMLVSTFLGMLAGRFLNEKVAKIVVIVFLIISGVWLIVMH